MCEYGNITIEGFDLCCNDLNPTIDYIIACMDPDNVFNSIYDDKEALFSFLGDDKDLWLYFSKMFINYYIHKSNIVNEITSHKNYNSSKDELELDLLKIEVQGNTVKFNTYYNGGIHRTSITHNLIYTDLKKLLESIKVGTISNLICSYIKKEKRIPVELLGNDSFRWDVVYRYLNNKNVRSITNLDVLLDKRLKPLSVHITDVEVLKLNYHTSKIYTIFEQNSGNYKVCRILLDRLLDTVLGITTNISSVTYEVSELLDVDNYGAKRAIEDTFAYRDISGIISAELAILITMLTVDFFVLNNPIPKELIIYCKAKFTSLSKYMHTPLRDVASMYYASN